MAAFTEQATAMEQELIDRHAEETEAFVIELEETLPT